MRDYQATLSRRLGPVFAEMAAQAEQAAQDDALLAELAKPIGNPAMPPCHCGLRAEVQWRAGAQCSEHSTFKTTSTRNLPANEEVCLTPEQAIKFYGVPSATYKPTHGGYPWAG